MEDFITIYAAKAKFDAELSRLMLAGYKRISNVAIHPTDQGHMLYTVVVARDQAV
jgi:hypothetical protein